MHLIFTKILLQLMIIYRKRCDNLEYNRDKFKKGAMALINKPILYVEGKCSKSFYLQLKEIKDFFLIQNGGSCERIKSLVESEKNSFGIIDKDYRNLNHPKLFPLNFYSIENISLIYIDSLSELKNILKDFIEEHGLINASIHIPLFTINYHPNQRAKDFILSLTSGTHHAQFIPYIQESIICTETFLKYKDLKKLVELYVKYYKLTGKGKINYITDLSDHIPSKSIKHIFLESMVEKIENVKYKQLQRDLVS